MTAPALVLLAHGSDEPKVASVARSLRDLMAAARPSLDVCLAFVDHCGDHAAEVVAQTVARGTQEIVFIPLDLARAIEPAADTVALLEAQRQLHPTVAMTLARPLGPAAELLNILDERLRSALRAARTVELDALVLSLPSGGDVRGHALVSRRARQWSTHHKLPCVIAVADGSGPSVSQSIASLRGQGRRHIAVGSLFIADSLDFAAQSDMAWAHGAVAVSAPLGADDRLLDLVMARYAYAAMELLDPTPGADPTLADDDAELVELEQPEPGLAVVA